MMSTDERRKEIHDRMCEVSYEHVIALMQRWCADTCNGLVPPTPMSKWRSWCQDNHELLDWTKLSYFNECDSYFYIDNYGICSTDYLGDSISNCEFFHDCASYYAETFERYTQAMAILNGDTFIVNEVPYDTFI